jgi:hypothetical protein
MLHGAGAGSFTRAALSWHTLTSKPPPCPALASVSPSPLSRLASECALRHKQSGAPTVTTMTHPTHDHKVLPNHDSSHTATLQETLSPLQNPPAQLEAGRTLRALAHPAAQNVERQQKVVEGCAPSTSPARGRT